MDRSLLIVGFSTRGLADSAASAGFQRITAVDAFGDMDHPAHVRNISTRRRGLPFSDEAVKSICSKVDAELLAYGGGVENRPELIEELARGRLLAGNGASVARNARDVRLVRNVCREESIPFPETFSPEEVERFRQGIAKAKLSENWLVKRTASGGGTGVRVFRGGRLARGEVLQEYLAGRPASVSFIAHRGGVRIIGFTEQIIGWPPLGGDGFKWCGNITPLPGDWGRNRLFYRKAAIYAEIIAERFGLRGFNGIDMILGPDGSVAVIEINPRYSGSMELFGSTCGEALFSLHVASSLGEDISGPAGCAFEYGHFHAKGIVYAKADCLAPDTASWIKLGRKDIPWPGDRFSRGDPVCTVFASAPEEASCLGYLSREAEKVYSELVGLNEGGK